MRPRWSSSREPHHSPAEPRNVRHVNEQPVTREIDGPFAQRKLDQDLVRAESYPGIEIAEPLKREQWIGITQVVPEIPRQVGERDCRRQRHARFQGPAVTGSDARSEC